MRSSTRKTGYGGYARTPRSLSETLGLRVRRKRNAVRPQTASKKYALGAPPPPPPEPDEEAPEPELLEDDELDEEDELELLELEEDDDELEEDDEELELDDELLELEELELLFGVAEASIDSALVPAVFTAATL